MDKQEIQSKIEQIENKLSKLREELSKLENKELSKLKEELSKPETKVIKPRIGDIYYCLDIDGELLQYRWDDDSIDNKRYTIGNCFETEEKAEFEVERLKVIAELKRFAEEHNEPLDWNDLDQIKFYICFDYDKEIVYIGYWCTLKQNDIYFSSGEIAEQAIKEIGEDRVKKYYLGLEE